MRCPRCLAQNRVVFREALVYLDEHAAPPDVEEAEANYQQAMDLAEELGMRPLQAHCHLGLATPHTKINQSEQARAELSAAIDPYLAMNTEMTFWLPQAEAALAKAK